MATTSGTDGSDILIGGSGSDTIDGGAGDDFINSGSGSDTVNGGTGSDTINAGSGNDTLIYDFADALNGSKDVYIGGSGVDTLTFVLSQAQYDAYQSQFAAFQAMVAAQLNKTGELSNSNASNFVFNLPNGCTLTVSMIEKLDFHFVVSNHAPVVAGPVVATVMEDAQPSVLEALANASDVDAGDVLSVVNVPNDLPEGVTYNAANQTFTLDPAHPAYQHLAAEVPTEITVNYGVTDGTVTTDASVTWTVTGTNDPATITGTADGALMEDMGPNVAAGSLEVQDPDDGQSGFLPVSAAALAGTYGNFTFTNGVWNYVLANGSQAVNGLWAGQIEHDTLVVTSLDGTAIRVIDVAITGINDIAVISGTNSGVVTEDWWTFIPGGSQYAKGTLTVTDEDTGQASFQAAANLTGNYGSFTFNPATGSWTYDLNSANADVNALTSGAYLEDYLTVTSMDGSASQTITVRINGADELNLVNGVSGGTVNGTSGADLMEGTSGPDNLNGNSGNDVLKGYGGADSLSGNNGADILIGGSGSDSMTGGNQMDYFVFDSAIGSDIDSISSFNASEDPIAQDFIALDLAVFGALAPAAMPGDRLALGASQFATTGSLDASTQARIVFDTGSGALYLDTDGGDLSTGATHFATVSLQSGTTLDASDFVLYMG